MANYMSEVAKMLGVELGEEFEINEYHGSTFTLTDSGLSMSCKHDFEDFTPIALSFLLKGKFTIKHKPWKPKDRELYYYIAPEGILYDSFCSDDLSHVNMYKLGNCYRTREEAEVNRDKWVAFYASDEVLEV